MRPGLTLTFVASAILAAGSTALAALPEAEPGLLPVQKALRFAFPDGSETIYSLGALDPLYQIDAGDEALTVRVLDSAGDSFKRTFTVQAPEGTSVEEVLYAPPVAPPAAPAVQTPFRNHNYNCNAYHFCSDLDVSCNPFCQTWHGMQVNEGAACCSAPGNAFYQYACDSGWACTIHLYTHYQTQQQTWGQIVCYQHDKPAGYDQDDAYYVWSRSVNNGISIESWAASFTTDTAGC